MIDLQAIFGDGPALAPVVLPEPVEALGRFDFSDWVLRPDSRGRLGWEAPDLPEADRWWARCDFDDLPEIGPACPKCGGCEAWFDLLGARHCQRCESELFNCGMKLADYAERLRLAEGMRSKSLESDRLMTDVPVFAFVVKTRGEGVKPAQ